MASHWRILLALALGLVYGVVAAYAGWGEFTADWIVPFGTIFFRLLLFVAVPLVLASSWSGRLMPHSDLVDSTAPASVACRRDVLPTLMPSSGLHKCASAAAAAAACHGSARTSDRLCPTVPMASRTFHTSGSANRSRSCRYAS